jgi:hypothetical protein
MTRVGFMIIGAQKSGTTSLAWQLSKHPEVCFCRIKEPAYFNRTENWRGGLDEYHALYSPRPGQLLGEASTMYTFLPEWKDTHRRLHDYNPQLKLIYIMRDPVERIVSHYSFRHVRARVRVSPADAIATDPTYIDRSRYAMQLRPYLDLFGRAQILPLVFEEYIKQPTAALEHVARFLGIDATVVSTLDTSARGKTAGEPVLADNARRMRRTALGRIAARYLPSSVKSRLRSAFSRRIESNIEFPDPLRASLWRELEPEVQELERIVGRPLDVWRRKHH